MKNKSANSEKTVIEKHIGQRLQLRRLECGLSLEDVDEQIGGAKGRAKSFEDGTRFIGPGDLLGLSKILNVDVSFFFQETGECVDKPSSLAPATDMVASARRLVKAYYNIQDPALRRNVAKLLKDIADGENPGQPSGKT